MVRNPNSPSITRKVLDGLCAIMIMAVPIAAKARDTLTVEESRLLVDSDRALERLQNIDLNKLDDDALKRYGEVMASAKGLTLKSVGPVADQFAVDKSAISIIMGPYGSAKTTTAFKKIIMSALWQPTGRDGVKRVRWVIIRDTYGHLTNNVLADWFMWFPRTDANFSFSTMTHKLHLDLPVAGKIVKLYIEVIFAAIGNQNAEEFAKGFSVTGAWLNEIDTLHQDVFKYIFPRCGRYRPAGTARGGWSGLIGDMNAPDQDSWTYDFCVNKNYGIEPAALAALQVEYGKNFEIKFHVQPGAREANAENLPNLPIGYYARLEMTMTEQEKSRFIDNKFGAVSNGNPVYTGYRDKRHCLVGMKADPSKEIHFGVDGGATPATVFGQKADNGQIRAVDECVIFQPDAKKGLQKVGAKEYGQFLGDYWNENYSGFRLGVGWGDPSAWFGDSEANAEDRAWIYKFVAGFNERAIGVKLKMKPAPVKRNLIGPRLEAVRDVLKDDIDGEPKFVISDKCKVFRGGFNSGYVTVRVQYSTGGGRWKSEPVKNDYSHVHDGGQYLVLGLTKFDGWQDAEEGENIRARNARKGRGKKKYGNNYFSPTAA